MAEIPRGELYEAYRDAIQRRVCRVCLDQRDDGRCGLSSRVCVLEAHLPRIVEAILPIESDRMDDYVEAIRAQVCEPCPHQDADGHCELRGDGECALDAYLPLVVDAIEEVRGTFPGGR